MAVFSGPAWAQDAVVPASVAQLQLSFSPVVKKVAPAVVNIFTKRTVSRAVNPFMNDPLFAPFFRGQGHLREQVESSLGSGVIVEAGGLVVTNAHVIRGATEIKIVLTDGREFDAKLVLEDDASDLSLLRIDTKGEKLPYVDLKPSENLEVGDLVLAIGNPFGVGQTVTSGIVSARGSSALNINDYNFFIQTDAAINPGNSGGPLVTLDGNVVGINSAIYSRDGGSLGIGFAIPSEMVATLIAAESAGGLPEKGITRAWLGVTVQPVTPDIASSLGLEKPGGALISKLHSASPLAAAGIKVGDVVTAVDGKAVRDPGEMKFRMSNVAVGGSADFEVVRKGKKSIHTVKASTAPDKPARQETVLKDEHLLKGATIANINPAVAVQLGLDEEEQGVAVLKLEQGSTAQRFISPGDILLEINGQKISKPADAEKALKPGQGIGLVVKSRGAIRKIVIR
jgi:Do/DeqQ family serine protease